MPTSEAAVPRPTREPQLACKIDRRRLCAFYDEESGRPVEGQRRVVLDDGSGLSLAKERTKGAFIWLQRYSLLGKRRVIHLGRYPEVSLERARAVALLVKYLVWDGIDPVLRRRKAESRLRELLSKRTRGVLNAQPTDLAAIRSTSRSGMNAEANLLLLVHKRRLPCKLNGKHVEYFYWKESKQAAPAAAGHQARLNDGGGLSLVKRGTSGAFTWLLRYSFLGGRGECRLGRYPDMSLESARGVAMLIHDLVSRGIEPLLSRRNGERGLRETEKERLRRLLKEAPASDIYTSDFFLSDNYYLQLARSFSNLAEVRRIDADRRRL